MIEKNRAFTLIELIVSMFILSIMSVAALSSFQQMIHAREVQKSHESILNSLSFAYTTLLNDFAKQMKQGSELSFQAYELTLAGAAGEVLYTWDKGTLVRTLKNDDASPEQTLIKAAQSVKWEWLSEETWQDVSVPNINHTRPRAFQLSFTDSTFGEVSWIFIAP